MAGFEEPNSFNPYAAPLATPEGRLPTGVYQEGLPLAALGDRLAGSIIDGLITTVVYLPVYFILLAIAVSLGGLDGDGAGLFTSIILIVGAVVILVACFLAINGHLLSSRGQTVGKYVMRMQIQTDSDSRIPEFWPMFFKRYVALWALGMIPYIGALVGIIDALAVFRQSRKCLHDEIAGTKVVKLP